MSRRGIVLVPASSPSPIRESQPKPPDSRDPSQPTTPGRALFDSPSPGTQPAELTRNQRSRTPSYRKREQLSAQGQLPSSAPVSDAPTSSKSALASGKPRKSKKRAVVLSASDEDDEPARTRQARDEGTTRPTSQPKPASRSVSVAPGGASGSPGAKSAVTLNPDTAATLGKLFGVDFATMSSHEFNHTVQSLSGNQALQVGPSKRHSKVRGSSSSPLSTLNKQGGYHRERLDAHISSGQATKCSLTHEDSHTAKQPRLDRHSQPEADELEADPFANDEPASDRDQSLQPLPPPVFGTQIDHSPPASSTQRAVVNVPLSRLHVPKPAPATPSQKPGFSITEAAASARGLAITPVPQPKQTRHSAGHQAATPEHEQAAPPNNPPPRGATHKSRPPPPPPPPPPSAPRRARNPNTATESETESEPAAPPVKSLPHPTAKSQQPPKSAASKAKPNHTPSHTSNRHGDPAPPTHDRDELMEKLKHVLAGGEEEVVLDWALHFIEQCAGRPDPAPSKPGPSKPGPSTAGPSKPRAQHNAVTDLHSRFQANARARPSNNKRRHSNHRRLEDSPTPMPASEADDLPEPHELAAAIAAASTGAKPPANEEDGTGLGKYRGVRRRVASRAVVELCAHATARGVYQSQDTYMKWALNCYRRAWKKHAANMLYEDPPDGLLKTMVLRISWLRTTVKDRLRRVVHFKLKFRRPGNNQTKVAENQRLYAKLFPDTFHCFDHVTDRDQYEHPAFINGICEAFFWAPDSFVIQFPKEFQVMPLPAIAFVLTMMQEAIEEWQTGRFHPRDLHFARQQPIFDAHLRGLYVYEAAADRMYDFRESWFRCGMEYAGVTIHDASNDGEGRYCQPTTRAENVRPNTPNRQRVRRATPDPEPDYDEPVPQVQPEYDENGRLTSRAKGKSYGRRELEYD